MFGVTPAWMTGGLASRHSQRPEYVSDRLTHLPEVRPRHYRRAELHSRPAHIAFKPSIQTMRHNPLPPQKRRLSLLTQLGAETKPNGLHMILRRTDTSHHHLMSHHTIHRSPVTRLCTCAIACEIPCAIPGASRALRVHDTGARHL